MPGGRPPKPLQLVQGHRTKAEKAVRAKAESELLTGVTMKESPEVKKILLPTKNLGESKSF